MSDILSSSLEEKKYLICIITAVKTSRGQQESLAFLGPQPTTCLLHKRKGKYAPHTPTAYKYRDEKCRISQFPYKPPGNWKRAQWVTPRSASGAARHEPLRYGPDR
jgi:hypothetical protein